MNTWYITLLRALIMILSATAMCIPGTTSAQDVARDETALDSIPSFYGDDRKGSCYIRTAQGQVFNTDGDPENDIAYYFEHSPLGVYLLEKSTVSFTMANLHHDSTTADTLYRVDMYFGETDGDVDPVASGNPVGGRANYYLGSAAIENVKAYDKVVYRNVWDEISVHFYRSLGGPRMAFVVAPGGDPSDILLKFTGQDSIGVNMGAVKLYLDEKFVQLEQAIAYQVDENNEVVPLNWGADYEHLGNTAYITMAFDEYDTELPLVLEIGYPPMMLGGGEPEHRNLSWSTFAGSTGGDEQQCVEMDNNGDPYFCGYSEYVYYPIASGTTVSGEALGFSSAVMTKFDHTSKEVIWGTYLAGMEGNPEHVAMTQAFKLAVYDGPLTDHQYVFVTGTTTCTDLEPITAATSVFSTADETNYEGGVKRAWVAAFSKGQGHCHWATTHGETDDTYTWSEHGLAVDVDALGTLVVGGMIEDYPDGNITPDFELVTPNGAFSRAVGDGYFIHFDEDYGIEWSTAFAEYGVGLSGIGRVADVRISKEGVENHATLWLVGTSLDGLDTEPLDLVEPVTGYYQDAAGFYSAFIAYVDLVDHQLD